MLLRWLLLFVFVFVYITCDMYVRVAWGRSERTAQCARFGMPEINKCGDREKNAMGAGIFAKMSLWALTTSTVASLITVLALAALVAQTDPSVTAFTGGSLLASDFTMIAAQTVRAAAQIIANATAAILTGYHTLGCKQIAQFVNSSISGFRCTYSIHNVARSSPWCTDTCPSVCICRRSCTSPCRYLYQVDNANLV